MIRGVLWLVASASLGVLFPLLQPAPAAQAEAKPFARELLYPRRDDVPPVLKEHVERLLNPQQKAVEPGDAKANGVFLRVLSKKYAPTDAPPTDSQWLGTRPVTFLTVPEVAYGRNLLGIFSAIGYDPEDVIAEAIEDEKAGKDPRDPKVAVVFAYPDKVQLSSVQNGELGDDWNCRVYPTTWDNLFALTDRLAANKERVAIKQSVFDPTKLSFQTERELAFVYGFPKEGKDRVAKASYAALRETGGADWEYRQLIERLFGATEHFRGDGKTKLTIAGRQKPRAGFVEFLGPNTKLKDLRIAVISLGPVRVGG